MHEHETTAAEISRPRQRHGKRKAGRNGGIDCISALPQYRKTDLACLRLLARDHAALRIDRMEALVSGDNRKDIGMRL